MEWKEAEIVLAKTKHEGALVLTRKDVLLLRNSTKDNIPFYGFIPNFHEARYYELYIVDNGKIMDKEWVMNLRTSEVFLYVWPDSSTILSSKHPDKENMRRVIATTDVTLGITQIDEDYLNEYIKKYNMRDVIKTCMIEYGVETAIVKDNIITPVNELYRFTKRDMMRAFTVGYHQANGMLTYYEAMSMFKRENQI